ncbi:hypothetical protein BpHYR1_053049 [Brachionus plicatilis]|uniref:Uncharacterized protein n=1 Tax=Brachionus plicatilis TaxID=10195 RepID=A0A3M7T0D4_BRAPC|nr:hypothetical protein BpHYR1_053049 [Brachionus plicatilis]
MLHIANHHNNNLQHIKHTNNLPHTNHKANHNNNNQSTFTPRYTSTIAENNLPTSMLYTKDTKEFFKNHVYVSCLEYLTKNIKERVIENFSELISAFGIFQKNFLIKPETAKENLEILVNFYSGDIEDDLNVVFNEYQYFSEWILKQELVESVKEV